MATINLPMAESYQPASFAERGVDAPFTAPLLAGARIRPMNGPGIELVVPNPSGGRGVYILPWATARTLCRPTVHDLRLFEELRRLPALTPTSVRLAARVVATQGLAGRQAQEAAVAAVASDAAARLRAVSLLWLALRSAALPGLTPERVARDLDALGVLFGPVGLPPEADAARLPKLLAALVDVRAETDLWARMNAGEEVAALAAMVSAAAESVIAASGMMVRDARALATDVPALLRQWARVPAEVAGRISRAEWLLDGWDRIILLWRDARWPATQRAALLEMAQLVPDLPLEAAGWIGQPPETLLPSQDCRVISLSEGWRVGSASFSLVARNERLRARSA
ncbi:MAG TPA: hypothetical protein VND19_24465 [Acetobacteraceae bacterium]|nr:hypothetical protein [Acetobacteraceae bacterium]